MRIYDVGGAGRPGIYRSEYIAWKIVVERLIRRSLDTSNVRACAVLDLVYWERWQSKVVGVACMERGKMQGMAEKTDDSDLVPSAEIFGWFAWRCKIGAVAPLGDVLVKGDAATEKAAVVEANLAYYSYFVCTWYPPRKQYVMLRSISSTVGSSHMSIEHFG